MDEEQYITILLQCVRKLIVRRHVPTFSKINLAMRGKFHLTSAQIKNIIDKAVEAGKVIAAMRPMKNKPNTMCVYYKPTPPPGGLNRPAVRKRRTLNELLTPNSKFFNLINNDLNNNLKNLRKNAGKPCDSQNESQDPKINMDNNLINNNVSKKTFQTKFELIRAIQELLVNNNEGLSLENIFQKIGMDPDDPELPCSSTLKQQISMMVFELAIAGILIQERNLFRVDQHRLAISEKLTCVECNNNGSLIDLTKPFIFCFNCGVGYHFKCAFKTEINPIFVIGGGFLCPQCKMCQICYNKTQESVEVCVSCSKGFHKCCRSKVVKSIVNEQYCNNCNIRSILSTEGQQRPEIIKVRKPRRRIIRSPKPIKPEKEKVVAKPRKSTHITPAQQQAKSYDLLQNLLKTHKFPDVTNEDIEMYKTTKDIITKSITQVSTNDPKICTPPYIQFGKFEIKSWYSSPFPQEYATVQKLHICEFCLEYRKTAEIMSRHLSICTARNPPDREIYRSGDLSVYEIDGQNYKNYCQNLCLIAKLYLGHKTLYYDVEPFLFYILTKNDSHGRHLVGYYSKEKFSPQKYNVSCVTTLPPYQRLGYGRFLIDFSYLLTREEGITGSPEKPLSALGQISYQAYWNTAVCEFLNSKYPGDQISFRDIMNHTGMDSADVVQVLRRLGMVTVDAEKKCSIIFRKSIIEKVLSSQSYLSRINLDPFRLRWSPFIKPTLNVETPIEPAPPAKNTKA